MARRQALQCSKYVKFLDGGDNVLSEHCVELVECGFSDVFKLSRTEAEKDR